MSGSIKPYVGVTEVKDNMVHVAKALLAEFIGTFFLVLIGCGSALGGPEVDVVRYSLGFGITVATMAQSIGHISGCHVNPAVTIGLFVGRKIGLVKGLLYIVVQCVGGIAGAGILSILLPTEIASKNLGQTLVNPAMSAGQGFGLEFLITFVLVLVVYGAAADEDNADSVKGSAPLAIGLSITIGHLVAGPFTGPAMNPARALGPAVILSAYANHWVYWAGPILGGVCAGLVYQMAFKAESKRKYDPANSHGDVELTKA